MIKPMPLVWATSWKRKNNDKTHAPGMGYKQGEEQVVKADGKK